GAGRPRPGLPRPRDLEFRDRAGRRNSREGAQQRRRALRQGDRPERAGRPRAGRHALVEGTHAWTADVGAPEGLRRLPRGARTPGGGGEGLPRSARAAAEVRRGSARAREPAVATGKAWRRARDTESSKGGR